MERVNRNRYLTTTILATITIFGALLQLSMISMVSADWGMIPVIPDVSVYEPGQKAIIAWNGQKEILILSADVESTADTTVLQIMPLPSKPIKIEEASIESFHFVEELIRYHMPPPPPWGYFGNETDQVKVVFHEQIGMHDITVVEVHSVSEFAEWMDEFLLKNGISEQVTLEDFGSVIEDYMFRDFNFYVLDLIETSSDEKSVEPILYEFNTNFLYYPLLITSPIGGDGTIILFLITQYIVERGYDPFIKAQYFGIETIEPIEFEVSNEMLFLIEPSIAELFEYNAWMTALVYRGPLGTLTEDLAIKILTGDLNGDGIVDIKDVTVASKAFGSYPGHPRWNPIVDLDGNGKINIVDIVTVAKAFGKTA